MGLLAEAVRNFVSTRSGGGWFGPFGSGDRELARLFGGRPVAAGVTVNKQTAMGYAPFAAAVTLISNVMASVPLQVFKRVGEGRERDRGHPLDRLVTREPNDEDSSFTFRRQMMQDALTDGVAYSEILRNRATGRVGALWPIEPDRVTPQREAGGRLTYRVQTAGAADVTLSAANVVVILGPGSVDGIWPSPTWTRAKEAIGLGLAAERYGAKFFGNGATPGLVAQHPGKLSEVAHARLKADLKAELQGPDRAHSLIVTEEGIKIEKVGIPPEDGQFLQTRQHQINEMARVFNVPPTLIGGNLEGGLTYANNLAEAQRFVDQCLLPWAALWEQELNRKLLDPDERDTHYFEMTFEGLLRGDVTTRYAAYRTAIESEFMLPNEARARENLPALPEGAFPDAPTNGARPRARRPDGADHIIVSEALARVLRRWGADFLRATSAVDVRQQLARVTAAEKDDEHTVQVLTTAFALVPGADARTVARDLRAECVQQIQQVLDTTPAVHVPGRLVQLRDKAWPVRAGSLAAEIIRNGGGAHGG